MPGGLSAVRVPHCETSKEREKEKKRLFTLTVNQRSGKTGSERSAKCRFFYCLRLRA